tara:strand:- start:441 stop:770 length:330 start_codon:yes stop_codon:yes gene_type:complete
MRINKTYLRKIIKEEIEKTLLSESVKQFIKNSKINSTVPMGALITVKNNNPELAKALSNSANPMGQADAIAKLKQAFSDTIDSNSKMKLGDGVDVDGFFKYADQKGYLS